MSFFSQIKDKIFAHGKAKAATPPPAAAAPPSAPVQPAPSAPAAAPAAAEPVDVGAVLGAMAEMKEGGGGNYQTSIVDLLKLLQLESSLDARKELAAELGVNAGAPGSAEQNIALHRAVMKKLVENGGQVPDSFYQ